MVSAMGELNQLLPFHVNGTLDGDERAAVERALGRDPALRAEAAGLARLREAMQAQDMGQSPGAFGKARLMQDLARMESAALEASPRAAAAPRRSAAPVTSMLAAAAIAGLFAFGVGWFSASDDASFTLASGGTVTAPQGPVLTVAFRPDATEAQIAALLRDNRLGIVEGPTAIGLYRVTAQPNANLAELATRLRAADSVIESVGLP
jgi:anti-sigma factor RsiW